MTTTNLLKVFLVIANSAVTFSAIYKSSPIGKPNGDDGIKAKPALSKIECVLVCKGKGMVSVIHDEECICFEDMEDSFVPADDAEMQHDSSTYFFKRMVNKKKSFSYRDFNILAYIIYIMYLCTLHFNYLMLIYIRENANYT